VCETRERKEFKTCRLILTWANNLCDDHQLSNNRRENLQIYDVFSFHTLCNKNVKNPDTHEFV